MPSEPRAVLEQNAATVDAAVQDLLQALDSAGLKDASARGTIGACQSEPAPGVDYRGGVDVKVGDDPAAGLDALARELAAAGWQRSDDELGGDEQTPRARFTREDIRVDVKTGGFRTGGEVHGADEMTLGITLADGCVRVPDGGYIAQVRDLEKEIRPGE